MKSFLLMLAFFTRIPVTTGLDFDDRRYKKGIKYLLVIALIIGVPVGLVMLLKVWIGPWVAAFSAFLLYLMITGGLHVDGLADTMDAFGSNRDRQKMLDIMKDSRIGTFGVLSICVYAIGMVVLLAHADIVAACLFPLAGRTAALVVARMFGYARPDGMGRVFVDSVRTRHVIILVLAYIIAVCLFSTRFFSTVLNLWYAGILLFVYISAVGAIALTAAGMSKKLGGITGDTIGFAIEAAQIVFLLLFCGITGFCGA